MTRCPPTRTPSAASFGYGWWNQDLDAAAELLRSAGFTEDGGGWTMPNGEPFEFTLIMRAEEGVINRLGTIAAQMWSQAGVPVTAEVAPDMLGSTGQPATTRPTSPGRSRPGAVTPTSPSSSTATTPSYIAEPGELQPARNWMRWQNPELDRIIEEIRGVDFNDLERNMELGKEFVRLHLQDMPNIPVMSFNVFVGDVGALLDGLSDLGESVRQSGEQLGQLQVHLDPARTGRRLTPEMRRVSGQRAGHPPRSGPCRPDEVTDEDAPSMKAYLWFAFKRAMQMIVVIFVGISMAFLITHLSPVNPVESVLGRITARSNFSPEAIEEMRSALTDLYGVDKPLPEQYVQLPASLRPGRPRPVVARLPHAVDDAGHAGAPLDRVPPDRLRSWSPGHGGQPVRRTGRLLPEQPAAQGGRGGRRSGVQPIPYYIVAFLLLYVFGFVWPILPISGAYANGRRAGLEHGLHPLGRRSMRSCRSRR